MDFIKCFFCVHSYDYVIFALYFVNVIYYIDWLLGIQQTLYYRDKSHLFMAFNPFSVLLDTVWSVVFFLLMSLSGSAIRIILHRMNWEALFPCIRQGSPEKQLERQHAWKRDWFIIRNQLMWLGCMVSLQHQCPNLSLKASRLLQNQEEPMSQFEDHQARWLSVTKRRVSLFFYLGFQSLNESHPHYGGQLASLSLPI